MISNNVVNIMCIIRECCKQTGKCEKIKLFDDQSQIKNLLIKTKKNVLQEYLYTISLFYEVKIHVGQN